MYLHAWYIERFVQESQKLYPGARLIDCYSLSKSELFFHWKLADGSFRNWRIQWDAQQVFVSFPEQIHPHSKGRLNQFESCLGKDLISLEAIENERCFVLKLSTDQQLVFKLHGRNANVLHFEAAHWKAHFRLNQRSDEQLQLEDLMKSGEADERQNRDSYLHDPILLVPRGHVYDLVPDSRETPVQRYDLISEAWHDLTALYLKAYHFHQRKQQLLQQRKSWLKKENKRLSGVLEKLELLREQAQYRHFGDLIFSNFGSIKKGMQVAKLTDHVSGKRVKVPLIRDLSPEQNAERYYRKSKNQYLEAEHLEVRKAELEVRIRQLNEELESLQQAEGFKDLKNFSDLATRPAGKESEERKPYYEFRYQDYSILVGRSSKDNDILSLKLAKKDDLWLHVRDVPGSHVIIRHRSGQNFPIPVIEFAAELAAAYSKLGKDSLCPVIYTPRKFIRKRKGDPAGAVVVEKEEVIMVEPQKHHDFLQ